MSISNQDVGRAASLALGLVIAFPGAPRAEDYCVVCVEPSAMYRCEIKGTPEGRGADPKAQLHCISELAKRGKHGSCLVSKSAPVPCPGLTVVLNSPGETGATVGDAHPPMRGPGPEDAAVARHEDPVAPPSDAQVSTDQLPPADATAPKASGTPAIAGAPKNDPNAPKTVEELAGKTVEATKDSISKAGNAVTGTAEKAGNAAKSTWRCISSFFSDC